MEHGSCGEHGCAAAISVPRIASAYPIFAKCICTAHSIGPISRSFPTVLNPDSPAIINDEAVFVRRLLSYVHRPLRSVIGHIHTHTHTHAHTERGLGEISSSSLPFAHPCPLVLFFRPARYRESYLVYVHRMYTERSSFPRSRSRRGERERERERDSTYE